MGVKNYKDLIAWQKAVELATAVYEATRALPAEERYGLTAQMRRAAVSIPANIAEGEGRGGSREFIHFLRIAHGSVRELETHVVIAEKLGYLTAAVAQDLAASTSEVGTIIMGLIRSLS
jgi:four helix bundle protein